MTILFESDWDLYPSAIVDIKTKNKSFIDIASKYKAMGISNHAFPLQLHNPNLQGIDPYDEDLTQEIQIAIAIECKNNFFYYLRECVRVPGSGYDNPKHLKANRGNMSLYWLFFNHIMLFLVQPRQTGKSFSTDVLMRYLLNVRCTGTQINLLTKDDALRAANLERLKNLEMEMPPYLKQRTRFDLANSEELTIKSLKNGYRGYLPNKSPKMAANVGRGLTSPVFQVDEAAFFYNIRITLPAALAAGTAARELSEEKSEPYGTILTSTAGKKDDVDGAYAHQILVESAIWTEKFLDCNDIKHLKDTVRVNSPKGKLRVNCTFSHRQLGYTDQWLMKALEDSMSVGEDADRDFFNIWTAGSTSSPLTVELLELIRKSERPDFHTHMLPNYNYITRWYIDDHESYLRNSKIIMSLDTSDALGDDNDGIAMHMRDVKTGGTVAAGTFNETNLISFAAWVAEWLIKYVNITLIVERRSSGTMMMDYITMMLISKGIDPFKRIYNLVVQNSDEDVEGFRAICKHSAHMSVDIVTKHKRKFGFATSAHGATSRSELYGATFLNAAKLTGDKVHDVKLVDEILGLIVKNGRVDHPPGGHDDMVIAWLLSYWVLAHGKNLSHYGINPSDVLIDNKVNKIAKDPATLYQKREQDLVKSEIELLVDKLSNSRDPYLATKLENKVRRLATKLDSKDQEILSVDELLSSLRRDRNGARNLALVRR